MTILTVIKIFIINSLKTASYYRFFSTEEYVGPKLCTTHQSVSLPHILPLNSFPHTTLSPQTHSKIRHSKFSGIFENNSLHTKLAKLQFKKILTEMILRFFLLLKFSNFIASLIKNSYWTWCMKTSSSVLILSLYERLEY